MFNAQLLIGDPDANVYSVFSPWFPRQGDIIHCTLGIIGISTTRVEGRAGRQRRTRTPGTGRSSPGACPVRRSDRSDELWGPNMLEQAACGTKFTVTPSDAGAWVLSRMATPVWFDTVRA